MNHLVYKKIAISNRQLLTGTSHYNDHVKEMLLARISLIGRERLADALILREKDLTLSQYQDLANAAVALCRELDFPLILHHFVAVADTFPITMPIHLSVPDFLDFKKKQAEGVWSGKAFSTVGVSTHTVEEALEAVRLGAAYITASHIFPTACKEGLAPRGLDYLKEVCAAVSIPVYALGGVHEPQIEACLEAGATGVCMMSEYFKETL